MGVESCKIMFSGDTSHSLVLTLLQQDVCLSYNAEP